MYECEHKTKAWACENLCDHYYMFFNYTVTVMIMN